MKSLLEEGSIGVDMPPLPDDIWNGVGLLLLIEEPTFSATSSDTLATWSIPENEPITTTANPCNGIKRWYDPITGRWLSKDPIGIAGGLNQYAFCGNNPVNFMDPFGLFTRAELVAIRDSQLAAHGAALQDANAAQTELSKIGYAKAGSTTALSTSAAGSAGALVLTGIPALGIAGAGTSTAAVGGGTALAVPTTTLGGTATIATGTVIPNPVLTSGATAAAVTATRASTGIWNYMRMKGKMVASQQALDSAVAAMEVAMNAARMAQRLIDEYDSESCPK